MDVLGANRLQRVVCSKPRKRHENHATFVMAKGGGLEIGATKRPMHSFVVRVALRQSARDAKPHRGRSALGCLNIVFASISGASAGA